MRVKAIIMKPDLTNAVVVLKKDAVKNKVFVHGNHTYFVDEKSHRITWRGWFPILRLYYNTYYYRMGIANPIPVNDLVIDVAKTKNPDVEEILKQMKISSDGTINTARYAKIINLGVSEEEMAAIFNPWFLRVIAPTSMGIFERIQLLLLVACAVGIGYQIVTEGQLI